jgi:NADPH:quinone reductase
MVADARMIAKIPDNLSFEHAAVLPLVSVTAWYTMVHVAKIQSDQTVLIIGGTGRVGHVALQLAKARGAIVAATVGNSAKAEIVKDLGADVIINYTDIQHKDSVDRKFLRKGVATVSEVKRA